MSEAGFDLYKKLYLIRRSEEFIIKHYPEDEMMTPMHMSMGEEAISAGVCHAIGSQGQVFASYRSHAAFLAKTEDVDRFFAELYGKETGTAHGKSGSMHLAAPEQGHMGSSAIVASSIPVTLGAAFVNKQKRNGQVSCVFFGDGAVNEGVFWESLNIASVMKLPVLFVCEDNGLAVHTPTSVRQGYKQITDIVAGFECGVFQADTTDVEVIYQLALDAIGAISRTGKPAFMYLKCYRYLEHVGISDDFNAGYRAKSEYEDWVKRDCLSLQRGKLIDKGYSEKVLHDAEMQIDERIKNSIRLAKEASLPEPEELYKGVFYETD
jgi:acetoin:2,6-dichlorophenolindophenol oxidoreductase subunit alpha